MPTLTEAIRNPGDLAPPTTTVTLELWGDTGPIAGYKPTSAVTIAGRTTGSGGTWSIPDVVGNDDITIPAGTVYRVIRHLQGVDEPLIEFIDMPTSGGPYRIDQILTDPPAALTPSGLAAHAADTAVHGGGQRIFAANVAANFTTASTTYVDLPGATATFTIPARPFAVFLQLPVFVEESNASGDIQILAGSTVVTAAAINRQTIAGPSNTMAFGFQAPLPIWNPTPGTSVTVKVQMKSSVATSDLTVFVDFGGPVATAQLWGMTV
jgi:hypothetical protein